MSIKKGTTTAFPLVLLRFLAVLFPLVADGIKRSAKSTTVDATTAIGTTINNSESSNDSNGCSSSSSNNDQTRQHYQSEILPSDASEDRKQPTRISPSDIPVIVLPDFELLRNLFPELPVLPAVHTPMPVYMSKSEATSRSPQVQPSSSSSSALHTSYSPVEMITTATTTTSAFDGDCLFDNDIAMECINLLLPPTPSTIPSPSFHPCADNDPIGIEKNENKMKSAVMKEESKVTINCSELWLACLKLLVNLTHNCTAAGAILLDESEGNEDNVLELCCSSLSVCSSLMNEAHKRIKLEENVSSEKKL